MPNPTPACLIDDTLSTALIAYPLAQGWVTDLDTDGLELVAGLTAEQVTQRGGKTCALLNSVDAALLAERFAVVTDLALVSHHAGAISLWTPGRPDEVEQATAALDGVSRTAEAVARATIPHFYGIEIAGWSRVVSRSEVVIREGVEALRQNEPGELSDLVRAWFILSGFPLPTHILVVPKDLAADDPSAVEALVGRLTRVLEVGTQRRRELRRNLAEQYDLNRERLLALHTEQTTTLSKTARKAWFDLLRRVGRGMSLPPAIEPTVISISSAD